MPPPRVFPFYEIKRIFLACPGDLVSERSRFPRLIETVNNLRAHSLGMHLEPVGWERVIPSFGRPQDLINEELKTADLVVAMFWNRIGSASSTKTTLTGTVEEFELATSLRSETGRPTVWVYFRKPTTDLDSQLQGVLDFRKKLEDGKDLFFREYDTLSSWEEMFREHLVAYLDGLTRWNLDRNFMQMRPDRALMKGNFSAEGIYRHGTRLMLEVDLDGDGNEETICFWFSAFSYQLLLTRFDVAFYLEVPEIHGQIQHLAIKDVNNDGLPEVLLAMENSPLGLEILVWGFTDHQARELSKDSFGLLGHLSGQTVAHVHEGGTIILPYGSQGLASVYKWTGSSFELTT